MLRKGKDDGSKNLTTECNSNEKLRSVLRSKFLRELCERNDLWALLDLQSSEEGAYSEEKLVVTDGESVEGNMKKKPMPPRPFSDIEFTEDLLQYSRLLAGTLERDRDASGDL